MFELCRNRRRMKQRADASTAKLFRPELCEMIEWQFNAHVGLLAQRGNSREADRAVPCSTLKSSDSDAMLNFGWCDARSTTPAPSAQRDCPNNGNQRNPCAH